jgi:leucyl/phenylalanyl-tRNA--protein transferase
MAGYYLLNEQLYFPPVSQANKEGFLAFGGDLSTERLLLAYRSGIFPWYNEDEPIIWWSPDPRCVLFPNKLRISKSMHQVIKKGAFRFSINEAFAQVIKNCQQTKRKDSNGTWLNNEMIEAYNSLHQQGFAYSAECWLGDELVGGLYGIKLQKVFCGESMFSLKSNASKFAFIHFVHLMQKEGIEVVDCQISNPHLESLGAEMIPRSQFLRYL